MHDNFGIWKNCRTWSLWFKAQCRWGRTLSARTSVLHFIPILKSHGNQLRRNKTKKLSTGRRPRGRDMQQVPCLDLCLEKPIHMPEGDKKERKKDNDHQNLRTIGMYRVNARCRWPGTDWVSRRCSRMDVQCRIYEQYRWYHAYRTIFVPQANATLTIVTWPSASRQMYE